MITDDSIRRMIDLLDKQNVPRKGRYIEYLGKIYHEGHKLPKELLNGPRPEDR